MLKQFDAPTPRCGQEEYVRSIRRNIITLCTGYAGTGKTFLALGEAIQMLVNAKRGKGIQKIVIIRPYIQSATGERIGALPGSLDEKVTPYVQSIKDNLRALGIIESDINHLIANSFEFTVLSMCRGRSFNNCFVLVEEAQNVPINGDAMKMLLTRVGHDSKLVVAGDLDQCDLRPEDSGLSNAMSVLQNVPRVGIVEMNDIETIQRSVIVKDVLIAFKEFERNG